MSYLSITNFWRYQNADVWKKSPVHPPWFKHYVCRDPELDKLPPEARLLFWELLAVATKYANVFERDLNALSAETRLPPETIASNLLKLIQGGWIKETRSRRRSRVTLERFANNSRPTRQEEALPYRASASSNRSAERDAAGSLAQNGGEPAHRHPPQPKPDRLLAYAKRMLASDMPASELIDDLTRAHKLTPTQAQALVAKAANNQP